MKNIFYLTFLSMFLSFCGGYYFQAIRATSHRGISLGKKRTTCEQQLEETLQWERRITEERDEAISKFTRLSYRLEEINENYRLVLDSLKTISKENLELSVEVVLLKKELTEKQDSLQIIKQKYFTQFDLSQLLREELTDVEKKLKREKVMKTSLEGLVICIIFTVFILAFLIVLQIFFKRKMPDDLV
ncbi:MAG: hypothetical protein R2824_15110 [Saprospiraceae bacterium]